MKLKIKNIKNTLFLNWKSLLLFHLIYSMLFSVFIYWLFTFLFRIAIKLSGFSYITPSNIFRFLISPFSIFMLVLTFILTALSIYIDGSVLFFAYQSSLLRHKISAFRIMLYVLKSRPFLHVKGAFPLISYIILSNMYFLYYMCFKLNPLCTFLPYMFSKVKYALLILCPLLLICIYAVRHIFSLCMFLYGDYKVKELKHESRKMARKHIWTIFKYIIGINALIVLVWFILKHAFQLILVLCVKAFVPKDLIISIVLSINNILSTVLIWFSIVLSFFLNIGIITLLYNKFRDRPVIETPAWHAIRFSLRQKLISVLCSLTVLCLLFFYMWDGIYNGAIRAERPVSPILTFCHRGLSSQNPENSIPAIESAIAVMADGVEIDVQLTKDGVVVLSHDSSLKRTANITKNIYDLTYEELINFDIGSYLSPEFKDIRIPTLEQVMNICKGKINLIIELKRTPSEYDLAEKVCELIYEYDMEQQCCIQSTDHSFLEEIDEKYPDIKKGYILMAAIGNYCKDPVSDFFCVRSMFVNDTTVSMAHNAGKEIYAWTVNTRAEAERMKQVRVDAIITDYPAKISEVLYRTADSESLLKILSLIS